MAVVRWVFLELLLDLAVGDFTDPEVEWCLVVVVFAEANGTIANSAINRNAIWADTCITTRK